MASRRAKLPRLPYPCCAELFALRNTDPGFDSWKSIASQLGRAGVGLTEAQHLLGNSDPKLRCSARDLLLHTSQANCEVVAPTRWLQRSLSWSLA